MAALQALLREISDSLAAKCSTSYCLLFGAEQVVNSGFLELFTENDTDESGESEPKNKLKGAKSLP